MITGVSSNVDQKLAVKPNAMRRLVVRQLARQPYQPVWQAMRDFTDARRPDSADELWLVEHEPVFTQGLAGRPEHVLNAGDIPLIQTDRGGQVTYHGPGQQVIYPLLDLERLGLGVRSLVCRLEQIVIDLLAGDGISGTRRDGAPGVFVGQAKIASIGLKVRRQCSYHGLAFNVDMDLEPFDRINPCGFAGMEMTCWARHSEQASMARAGKELTARLFTALGYDRMPMEADANRPVTVEYVENF